MNEHRFCLSLVLKTILFSFFCHQRQKKGKSFAEKKKKKHLLHRTAWTVCRTDVLYPCTAEKAGAGLWEKLGDVFLSTITLQNGDAIAAFIWWESCRQLLASVCLHWWGWGFSQVMWNFAVGSVNGEVGPCTKKKVLFIKKIKIKIT